MVIWETEKQDLKFCVALTCRKLVVGIMSTVTKFRCSINRKFVDQITDFNGNNAFDFREKSFSGTWILKLFRSFPLGDWRLIHISGISLSPALSPASNPVDVQALILLFLWASSFKVIWRNSCCFINWTSLYHGWNRMAWGEEIGGALVNLKQLRGTFFFYIKVTIGYSFVLLESLQHGRRLACGPVCRGR